MQGAREYAHLFKTGQYGRLWIESHSHARGKTFKTWHLSSEKLDIGVASVDHLQSCEGCSRCDFLMSLYTACDKCGHWMWNECEHYYNEATGECLCGLCEPK